MIHFARDRSLIWIDTADFKVKKRMENWMERIANVEKLKLFPQPRGHVLLIGIGGSGRQSLSRIASYMCELATFQIAVTKHYRLPEFREDLKILYSKTGVENKPTTFLFVDTQVIEEQFLEVVNSILSTGEVTNLFKADEMEEVSDDPFSISSQFFLHFRRFHFSIFPLQCNLSSEYSLHLVLIDLSFV